MSPVSDDVPHLGTIEGREVPPAGVEVDARVPTATPTVPTAPPATVEQLVPAMPARPTRTARVRTEVSGALHDIRDAHRRGPKPNSRPLPEWVRGLAWVLDDAIEVPATGGRRVGIDGFLTIIPGAGDAIGVGLSMVVVTAGVLAGVSWPTIIRMLWNVTFEGVVGLIPFAGIAFDMVYKANDRNVRLIERDLADRKATRRSSIGVLMALVATTIAGIVIMFTIAFAGFAVLVWILWRLLA